MHGRIQWRFLDSLLKLRCWEVCGDIWDGTVESESDDRQGLVLAIDTHEIEERDGALQRSLSDERSFLAALEQGARHIFVDAEEHLGHILLVSPHINNLVAQTGYKLGLKWVAGVLTPKLLEVNGTERAVPSEDGVNLLEVVLHNLSLIIIAANWLVCIQERANSWEDELSGAC